MRYTIQTKNILFLLLSLCLAGCRKYDELKVFEKRVVSSNLDIVIINDTFLVKSSTIDLDLNYDGTTDFSFIYHMTPNPGSFYLYAITHGSNELLFNPLPSENNYINAFNAGDQMIGRWGTEYGDMVNPPMALPWENAGPKYLGFRLKGPHGQYYAGWLKLEIGKKGNRIIFYDYILRLDNSNEIVAAER